MKKNAAVAIFIVALVVCGWIFLQHTSLDFAQTSGVTFVGAGDIASGATNPEKTAKLLDQIVAQDPNTIVYTTGDNAYSDGTSSEFNSNYHPTWGRHRARTRPSTGNHDHHTSGATGYLNYFCPSSSDCVFPGGTQQLYYSYDAGGWHLIALDSELSMSASSAQVTWLKADLAAHPSQCILAYWHKPRFSSGRHGSSTSSGPLWDELMKAKADVVLNGHDHLYERFDPQNAQGQADPNGIREFVVGTGGAGLYGFGSPIANSVIRNNNTLGVLKFNLKPGSYDWNFVPVAGSTFTDSGSGSCANGGPEPTTAPSPSGAPTIIPSVQPTGSGACPKKPQGDADCNGTPSITDYAVWRLEYKGACTSTNLTAAACGDDKDARGTLMDADFNGDNKVSLADYQIWRNAFASGGGNTPTPTSPVAGTNDSVCLTRAGPKTIINGVQTARLDASITNGTNIDARGASWQSGAAGNYPVLFRYDAAKNQNVCWHGGSIRGQYGPSTTWDTYHGTTAFLVRSPQFRVESLFIERYGDGIGFTEGGSEWTISDVKMTDIRDDCVENDYKYNGSVQDSLLDGCYVGFSSRGHSGQAVQIDGRNNTFTITDTLVRLLPVTSVYKGPVPGHGPFFKWAETSADGYGNKLIIRNSIFRADQVPNHGNLGLPKYTDPGSGNKVAYEIECSNNTIVWLGPGNFPEPMPSCFTITKDKAVWDNAVAAWNARHPDLNK